MSHTDLKETILKETLDLISPTIWERLGSDGEYVAQAIEKGITSTITDIQREMVEEIVKEFDKMLEILLANESLRDEMAENGKQYILKNYTWPIIEKKYKGVVEKVTGKKPLEQALTSLW